jgi:hypothetical protein
MPGAWPGAVAGPPLGVLARGVWPAAVAELPGSWAVLLYTDGLIEGRQAKSDERLGVEGLIARLADTGGLGNGGGWEAGLEATLVWAEEEHGGPLADDVALMLLAGGPDRAAPPR